MKKSIISAAALALIAFGNQAVAASNGTQAVSLVLNSIIEISPIAGSGNASAVFDNVTDYDGGLFLTNSAMNVHGSQDNPDLFTWTVKSNRTFDVYVRAENPISPASQNMAYSGDVPQGSPYTTMDLTTLQIKIVNPQGGVGATYPNYLNVYSPIQKKTASFPNGRLIMKNGEIGVRTFQCAYKIAPAWAYRAGTYTANVVYTATQL